VSACLSQVGVLSKGIKGLIWFWAWRLLSTSQTLRFEEIHVGPIYENTGTFPLELFLISGLSPRHIDRQTLLHITCDYKGLFTARLSRGAISDS